MTRAAGCSSRKPSKDSSVRWKTEEPDSDQGTSGVFGCGAWGLKQEMEKRATWVRNIFKHRHITSAVPSCTEQKSNPAVVHTPPSVTHTRKCRKTASPLLMENNVASGFTKRWINIVRIPKKRTAAHLLISLVSLQQLVLFYAGCTNGALNHLNPAGEIRPPRQSTASSSYGSTWPPSLKFNR